MTRRIGSVYATNRPFELLPVWDGAACLDTTIEMFPDTGDREGEKIALKVCQQCPTPVLLRCREYAVATRQDVGIWGGMTTGQRRRLRRTMQAEARAIAMNADLG